MKGSKKTFAEALVGIDRHRTPLDQRAKQAIQSPSMSARTHDTIVVVSPGGTSSRTVAAKTVVNGKTHSDGVTGTSATELQQAQRCVGSAMTACLGMWFLPLLSGPAVNLAEASLVKDVLNIFGCYSEAAADSVFWFLRKKMLLFNFATYIPVAGVPLQLFETYALGQFSIHCASRPERILDESWMNNNWKEIEIDIFSGRRVIRSYEQFTGEIFPQFAEPTFISTVDLLSKAYRIAETVPGLSKSQDFAGQKIREVIHGAKNSRPHISSFVESMFNGIGAAGQKFASLAENLEIGIGSLVCDIKDSGKPKR